MSPLRLCLVANPREGYRRFSYIKWEQFNISRQRAVAVAENASVKLLANKTVRVACDMASEHHQVTAWIDKAGYHTYSLGRLNPMTLVLRSLDIQSDPQIVADELHFEGFPVVSANRLYINVGPRKSLSLTLLVEKDESSQSLLGLKRVSGSVPA